MGLAFVGALFAFISALQAIQAASPETVWVETWRLFGFLAFAGMFALLALRPRISPGLWELAFFHEAAMILLAYVLTRGWRSWRLEPRAG